MKDIKYNTHSKTQESQRRAKGKKQDKKSTIHASILKLLKTQIF